MLKRKAFFFFFPSKYNLFNKELFIWQLVVLPRLTFKQFWWTMSFWVKYVTLSRALDCVIHLQAYSPLPVHALIWVLIISVHSWSFPMYLQVSLDHIISFFNVTKNQLHSFFFSWFQFASCGSVSLESSYEKAARCIYSSTLLYEYGGLDLKPVKVNRSCFQWSLTYCEVCKFAVLLSLFRLAVDFCLSFLFHSIWLATLFDMLFDTAILRIVSW